jgi:hypothetical protein
MTGRAFQLALLLFVAMLFRAHSAWAAEPMAPSDIRTTFFNGQPFTATSPSGTKFTMIFTPDGKMTREPIERSGTKSAGTWKMNAKGFCTAWGHVAATCFTVVPGGDNKWTVQKAATTIATTVAVWSK